MTKVFIGGSRNLSRLPSLVTTRIENIISNGLTVLIGDANGADKAVQRYLADRKYKNVIVYCSGSAPRNNLAGWETINVAAESRKKDFRFYALKDERMAKDADYGFMLWDMKSKGTLNNVLNLLSEGKKALLYSSTEDSFYTIQRAADVFELLSRCDGEVFEMFEETLNLSARLASNRFEPAAA